jgi:hypothetical protein
MQCSHLAFCFRSPSVSSSPSHSPRQPRKAMPSSAMGPPPAPGPIDNTVLVAVPTCKVVTLTGEGGKLKRNLMLVRWRDFELVPDSLWKALFQWYGGAPALPRQVCVCVHEGLFVNFKVTEDILLWYNSVPMFVINWNCQHRDHQHQNLFSL